MVTSSTMVKVLVWILYIIAFSYTIKVNPIKYIINSSPLSKYASSENGSCSNTSVTMDGSQVCTTPQSSVLFDGVIPSLTARNNNTCWASQLLVLNLDTTITFEFSNPSSGITSLETVMFNCPQENIGAARRVILKVEKHILLSDINHMSCNHLIRACSIFTARTTNTITLSFEVSSIAQFPLAYYIAEMSFYDSTSDCSPPGIIDTSTSSTTPVCQDLEPEPSTNRIERTMPISSGTPNMQMSGDGNTYIPSTTNFTTSSVLIIIVVVAVLFLLSLIVPIVLIIIFHKRIRLTKHCFDLFSTTKIENCPETEKSSDNCSRREIGGNECNFDTYAQVLEKKVEKDGRERIAAIHNDPDPTQLYAKVDTTRKKKKSRAVEASSPDISDMYAVVNKEAKQHQKKGELNGNQESSELYSVVDKTKKKKKISNDKVDTKELYSVVNKAKIKESERGVSQL